MMAFDGQLRPARPPMEKNYIICHSLFFLFLLFVSFHRPPHKKRIQHFFWTYETSQPRGMLGNVQIYYNIVETQMRVFGYICNKSLVVISSDKKLRKWVEVYAA